MNDNFITLDHVLNKSTIPVPLDPRVISSCASPVCCKPYALETDWRLLFHHCTRTRINMRLGGSPTKATSSAYPRNIARGTCFLISIARIPIQQGVAPTDMNWSRHDRPCFITIIPISWIQCHYWVSETFAGSTPDKPSLETPQKVSSDICLGRYDSL